MSHSTKSTLYKVKPNRLGVWLDWCAKLDNDYAREVRAILDAEGIAHEFFLHFKINGDDFALGIEVISNNNRRIKYDDTTISHEHRLKKSECLEKIDVPDILYFS